jgi:hypothetical protein
VVADDTTQSLRGVESPQSRKDSSSKDWRSRRPLSAMVTLHASF